MPNKFTDFLISNDHNYKHDKNYNKPMYEIQYLSNFMIHNVEKY